MAAAETEAWRAATGQFRGSRHRRHPPGGKDGPVLGVSSWHKRCVGRGQNGGRLPFPPIAASGFHPAPATAASAIPEVAALCQLDQHHAAADSEQGQRRGHPNQVGLAQDERGGRRRADDAAGGQLEADEPRRLRGRHERRQPGRQHRDAVLDMRDGQRERGVAPVALAQFSPSASSRAIRPTPRTFAARLDQPTGALAARNLATRIVPDCGRVGVGQRRDARDAASSPSSVRIAPNDQFPTDSPHAGRLVRHQIIAASPLIPALAIWFAHCRR
jgi:hypothetical protein